MRPVAVASFPNRPLAELARGYLEEHGVAASVSADDGSGTQPEIGFVTGGAWLVVEEADADRARSVLDAVDPAGDVAGPARSTSRGRRWVAGTVIASMAVIGVWTSLVVVLG